MAGNRQHILPRFLLKGFASRIDGDKIFTWVYRKGTKPFQTTIENVSVEKHFYGKQGGLNADDEITKLETGYAYLIDEIRNAQDSTEITGTKLTEFIAHLVVRTKHVREFFRNSADYMIGQLETYLAEPANFRRLLLRNPDLIREELGKLLNGFNLPSEQKEILVGLVEHVGPMIVDEQMPEVQTMLHDLMVQVKPHIAKAVNDGHIKALASSPAPEPRSENYRTLKWFVKQTEENLLLGDFGCLFEIDSENRFKSFNDNDDKILTIYLPVSSHTLILGTASSNTRDLNVSQINSATARCSCEYFVCSAPTDDREVLAASIGVCSELLTRNEMDTLMSEILADLDNQP
jgi:hypothetical protein